MTQNADLQNGQPLPTAIREIELLDGQGEGHAVGNLIKSRIAVLVFLRHFGCIACQEHVGLWKPHLPEFNEAGARVIFIGNGKPESLRKFLGKTQLRDDQAYTEPTQSIHRELGLVNSLGSTISPGAVFNALRAVTRGNFQTSVEGDPMQQGGVLIVDASGDIALLHRERQLGDYLDIAKARETVDALKTS